MRISGDFRDNLIIDRYDALFARMRAGKTDAMRSENSEDALTWNAFRTVAQIDPAFWYPRLFAAAFGESCPVPASVSVRLWVRSTPPDSLLAYQPEGESEVDVVLETESSVWYLEAKYKSDISEKTTHGAERDQILRNIDVGSWNAGVRPFYFALLALGADRSARGIELVSQYAAEPAALRAKLPHRSDGLVNVRGIGLLLWSEIATVLEAAAAEAKPDERQFAERATAWLQQKGIKAMFSESSSDESQRSVMRRLFAAHNGSEDATIRAYAEAEDRGEIARRSNQAGLSAAKYARALYSDGIRKGWLR